MVCLINNYYLYSSFLICSCTLVCDDDRHDNSIFYVHTVSFNRISVIDTDHRTKYSSRERKRMRNILQKKTKKKALLIK